VQPGIAPQVRVYAEAEEEYIYLWVEDNGIGIAEKGVAELGYDTGKNTGWEPKMISGILMGNWNISKF